MSIAGIYSEFYVEGIPCFGLSHLVFLVSIYRNVEGFYYSHVPVEAVLRRIQ